MGTVFNRGTKGQVNWYVGYRKHLEMGLLTNTLQPTKANSKRFVREIEGRGFQQATVGVWKTVIRRRSRFAVRARLWTG